MCKQQILTFRVKAREGLETMELEMSKVDNRTPRFLKRQEVFTDFAGYWYVFGPIGL